MKETSERTANKPLIFLTNDDGVNAKGLRMLIETLRQEARLLVVAPEQAQSGMGHAITLTRPLYLKKVTDEPGLSVYACNGTPVDCVKIAFDCMMLGKEMPSLVVSGINHGSNSAINVLYSGTMGAAIEGGFYDIPSIGFSLLDHDEDADFSAALSYVRPIIERAMNSDTLGRPLCLNVNVPNLPADRIKGIKACRQNRGFWREEFERRQDPRGQDYYWITGYFHNTEPGAQDTDEWALDHGYVSIVPIQVDLTNYRQLERMKRWEDDRRPATANRPVSDNRQVLPKK